MMWRTVIAVLILVVLSFAQDSGPFGFREGMTRKQVEQAIGAKAFVSEDGDDVTYSTAPQSHPDFSSYKLTFSRTYGLVRLVAQSKDIDEDKTFTFTSAKCQEIQTALAAKYGKPEVSPKTQCPLEVDKEKPCTIPSAFYKYWPISVPPRKDKIVLVFLGVLVLPWTTNDHGEKVVAGCPDPRARLAGQIAVVYTFDDFEKYEEEIKKVF
jgi:hypothetical protein